MFQYREPNLGWVSSPDSSQSSNPPSSGSELEELQDSMTKRHRRALYFHRPPVWHYSSRHHRSSPVHMPESHDHGLDEVSDMSQPVSSLEYPQKQKSYDAPSNLTFPYSESDFETPLLSQLTLPDYRPLPKETPQGPGPFLQVKPVFCTRLKSYKDIRLGLGEQWAIQEGSLVIGLDPSYTSLNSYERRLDEFEVSAGDFYVVCALYADLWALCAKISSVSLSNSNNTTRLAFLPLCTVTLAVNYGAFVQRSMNYSHHSSHNQPTYPGGGLPVMPPHRSHSLNASKQVFNLQKADISLPSVVHDVLQNLSPKPADADFVPLDSTLEPIFSNLTSRRQRLRQSWGTRMSLLNFHSTPKPLAAPGYFHGNELPIPPVWRQSFPEDGGQHKNKGWSSSSGASNGFKWLTRKSW